MESLWQLQEAKNKFSEVVDRALKEGAQVVTRRGKKIAVILSYDEYRRMRKPMDNLAQFLLRSPLAASELAIERDQTLPRDIGVEP